MLSPGDVLSGRYRLDEPVADGGMGEVWRATDVSLGRTVAVKVVRPGLVTDPGFDARFRAEARMMASLAHPNVVNVYDYGRSDLGQSGSVTYLVMAYVDGEPLSRRIADAGRLSPAETMSIVAQAADALHAAHMHGIVHRDVKPANLLVQPNGAVKLVDFGVARSPAVTQVTADNAILGTAMYMAPEQASGHQVSPATDIYALGAVAYHCLAGQPPFNGDTPLEIALQHVSDEPPPLPADVPPRVRMLVARALAKNPADRFPTAAALAATARAMPVGPYGTPTPTVRSLQPVRLLQPARAVPAGAGVGAGSAGTAAAARTAAAADTAPAAGTAPVAGTAPAAGTAPVAGTARAAAELDAPTRPDLRVLVTPPQRQPRRGPRLAAVLSVAGVAAAVLLGLAAFGGLIGHSRPAGTRPAEVSEHTRAPIAPATAPSTAAPQPTSRSGSRPAVPVRAGARQSAAPAVAPAPTAAGTAPTAAPAPTATATTSAPAPTGGPTTSSPEPTNTAQSAPTTSGPSAPPAGSSETQ